VSSTQIIERSWPALAGKRQLAGISASGLCGGRAVQGRRRRRPQGAQPWTACPPHSTSGMSRTRAHAWAAETTDVRGRFDDESRSYTVVTTVARGRAHMTVLRREDVQSEGANWNRSSYRMVATPILIIVPRIIRRLRGPAWAASPGCLHSLSVVRSVSSRPRGPVAAPPIGTPPARARSRPRSWGAAYSARRGTGSVDTTAVGPYPQSQ
jgi:hypothetical protein